MAVLPEPDHWSDRLPSGGAYLWLMVAGILISAGVWMRRSRNDPDLLVVYLGALGGAFIGAKLAYLFAEAWGDWGRPDRWLRLATGKSIIGGLLGGYAGVDGMKRLVGYRKSTGDAFAPLIPVSILLGRVGCLLHGCCLGSVVPATFPLGLPDRLGTVRWPAVPVEMAFQGFLLILLLVWSHTGRYAGRRFFIYLTAYGGFRLVHEGLRDTPKWVLGIGGYQVLSLGMMVLGIIMIRRRCAQARMSRGTLP